MNEIELKVKLTSRDAKLPEYAHPTDAGMDLRSIEFAVIKGGEWKLIQTGVAIELPEGYEAQVRPRSGNALKHGITVLNTPGTIDACYRGNIGVILMNVGKNDITVEVGDKIAQLVVMPVTHANVIKVDELSDTERGDGGFGSTGK